MMLLCDLRAHWYVAHMVEVESGKDDARSWRASHALK